MPTSHRYGSDDILLGQGQEAMQNIIDGALPMVEYIVRQKIPSSLCITETRNRFANEFILIVGRYRFSYCLEGYIQQLGRLLSVPIDALKVDG